MKRDNSNTRRLLVEARIEPGMRMLELGCGGGEVTELLASLVGETGRVLALDRMPAVITAAAARMHELGYGHVGFHQLDLAEGSVALPAEEEGRFDALVGRRVLMYLPDPAAALRAVSPWLRHGARVVFEESDATMVPGRLLEWPAHDEALSLLRGNAEPAGHIHACRFFRRASAGRSRDSGATWPVRAANAGEAHAPALHVDGHVDRGAARRSRTSARGRGARVDRGVCA